MKTKPKRTTTLRIRLRLAGRLARGVWAGLAGVANGLWEIAQSAAILISLAIQTVLMLSVFVIMAVTAPFAPGRVGLFVARVCFALVCAPIGIMEAFEIKTGKTWVESAETGERMAPTWGNALSYGYWNARAAADRAIIEFDEKEKPRS